MSQAFRCDSLDTPQAYIWNEKNSQKIGLWKFRDWAQITLFWSLGTLKGTEIKSKCVVTLSLTPSDHSRAVGTKSGPPGPSEGLGGPQKGLLGPNQALLGLPGAQKGPDIRSKCVLTMSLTQVGQWGAGGTKSGSPWPSEDLWGPQKGLLEPKRALLGAVEVL